MQNYEWYEEDPPKKSDTSTGIVLGKNLKKRLQKLAAREDRSVSSIIRILLLEALDARNIK